MIRWLMSALALALAADAHAPPPTIDPAPILKASGFTGFALVARGDTIVWQTLRAACSPPSPDEIVLCHPRDPAFLRWPWASVTKQVLAVLAMHEVDRGALALDVPASRYLPALAKGTSAPTIRQLLQHRSGLRNPDDSPNDAEGTPSWYTAHDDTRDWCLRGRTAPGGNWRYNNCDSIVLGAILEQVTGQTVPALFAEHIAKPAAMEATAFASATGSGERGFPETAVPLTAAERAVFARFGAAGGLIGTPLDLLKFDRALMTGKLLSPAARDALWAGDPELGFMALSQWSFTAQLKGCSAPVRLVERRGAIGRFQVRNILLPDRDMTVMLFTAIGENAFDFGEIWQGKGLSHDLLAAVACP